MVVAKGWGGVGWMGNGNMLAKETKFQLDTMNKLWRFMGQLGDYS